MAHFKIAAAQVASVRGDIVGNIGTHAAAIEAAAKQEASMLVFPELSLTGYELDLAAELAITIEDPRLQPLISLARQHRIEVVLGAPLNCGHDKPALGAIVISADGSTRTYRKRHLGGTEPSYFIPGNQPMVLSVKGHQAGIAICADASQSTHPQDYAAAGSDIYAAGVFLTDEWYATDAPRLASYAARYRMLVVMANHADSVGTLTSVGKSAVWAPNGELLAQANGSENALVIATHHNATWQGELIKI